MKMRKWNDEEIVLISNLGKPGHSMKEICRKIGVNPQQVYNKRSRMGVSTDGWNMREVNRMREMASIGLNHKQVSEAVGRSPGAVEQMATKMGIRFNSDRSLECSLAQGRWRSMRAGRAARKKGQPIDQCPIDLSFQRQMSWRAGWHDADMQAGNSVIAGRL